MLTSCPDIWAGTLEALPMLHLQACPMTVKHATMSEERLMGPHITCSMHSRRQARQKVWKSVEASLDGRLDAPDGSVAFEVWELSEASRCANATLNGLSASVEHICSRSAPLALGPDACNTQTIQPFNPHDTALTAQNPEKQTYKTQQSHRHGDRAPAHCKWKTEPAEHFQGGFMWVQL